MTIRPIHWLVLLCLVFLWGSSYLMVEVALQAWAPVEIAGLRIVLAAIVLTVVVGLRREHFPRDRRTWGLLLLIALVGNGIPFSLISWGQQHIESGLAGILAASTPLFVLLLAHCMLPDERLRRNQLAAFLLGFAGIVVLMGPDSLAALGGSAERLWAQLAILAAGFCYAMATIIGRRLAPASPVVTSAGVMLMASMVMLPLISGSVDELPSVPVSSVLAIAFLGVLGTGLASILYFHLLAQTGARFTSLLNYLVPVWAMGLGAMILGEQLSINAWIAMILILSGLVLISRSGDIAGQPKGRA